VQEYDICTDHNDVAIRYLVIICRRIIWAIRDHLLQKPNSIVTIVSIKTVEWNYTLNTNIRWLFHFQMYRSCCSPLRRSRYVTLRFRLTSYLLFAIAPANPPSCNRECYVFVEKSTLLHSPCNNWHWWVMFMCKNRLFDTDSAVSYLKHVRA